MENDSGPFTLKYVDVPTMGEWRASVASITYYPEKGMEPNAFHRWMQWLVLGVKWTKL